MIQLSDHPEIIAKVSLFLGLIYRSVYWYKMRNSRGSAYDIFEHRLEVASFSESIPSLLKKICNGLDLQAPSIPSKLIIYLDKHTDLILSMIREWTQFFTYQASFVAKDLKKKTSHDEIINKIITELKNE
ncbi:MAG: hypothetical protein ACFFG0_07505 [Candidatus Thorarchaeota archaeon]